MTTTHLRKLAPLCTATAELLQPLHLAPNDRIQVRMYSDNEFGMTTYATARGERVNAGYAASVRFFDRLSESKSIAYGRYIVAATDFNVLLTAELWGQDRIEFMDDASRSTFQYLLMRFMGQTECATTVAAYKENGLLPDPPRDWVDHPEFPLTRYQKVAAWNALQSEGYALFMQQGTGKTPTAIAVMCHDAMLKFHREGKPYFCIVVCPKNVKSNWAREIQKFCTVPGRVVVLRGGKLHRVKQLVEIAEPHDDVQFNCVITSYETLQRTWDALQMFEWDLGIADESHMFKSPIVKRTKAMLKLREQCTRRLALTGTPVANNLLDLWAQLEWVGEGMSGFRQHKNFSKYYNRYADNGSDNYQGAKVLIGYKNLPMLHERLARCSFAVTKKEAMPDLPEKAYDVIECGMGQEQRRVYKMLAAELAAEIERMLDDQPTAAAVTINNVLTKLLRLSQVTAGYVVTDEVYDDEGERIDTDRVVWFSEVPKMDEMIELLKAKGPHEKTIVWCCWIPALRRISERLEDAGIKHVVFTGATSEADRDAAVEAFNKDPKTKVFLGNPAAGGVGLNLPGYDAARPDEYETNADHAVYYAQNWSFIHRAQSEDRNHGHGRCRGSVRYTDLIVPGTIDMEIAQKLSVKKEVALEAGDVRAILQRILDDDTSED